MLMFCKKEPLLKRQVHSKRLICFDEIFRFLKIARFNACTNNRCAKHFPGTLSGHAGLRKNPDELFP